MGSAPRTTAIRGRTRWAPFFLALMLLLGLLLVGASAVHFPTLAREPHRTTGRIAPVGTTFPSGTLQPGPVVGNVTPSFWSLVVQTRTNTGIAQDPTVGQFLNASPFDSFRYSSATDECNLSANIVYTDAGVGSSPCYVNVSAFKAWCTSRPGCVSLFDLPGENNNSGEDAAIAKWIVDTVGFQPTYWSIGNEPNAWTHYGIPWTQWQTTDSSTPTPVAYAWDVHAAIAAVKKVDPAAKFVGIQADCQCATAWLEDTAKVNGPNLSAIAFHTYPTNGSTSETLQELYGALLGPQNLSTSMTTVRSAIAGECAHCGSLPIFVNEYNAGPGWQPSNWGGTFPNAVFLAASTAQAMRAGVPMLSIFDLQTTMSAYGYSLMNGTDSLAPSGALYSELLDHLGIGAVESVGLASSVGNVWPVLLREGSHASLLVANANISQWVNLSLGEILPVGASATTYLWTGNSSAPRAISGPLPSSLLLPAQAMVVVNVTLPAPLLARASANATAGYAPLAAGFTGNATGGVPPYSYAWSFGDGAAANLTDPDHLYVEAGNFTATLRVTDQRGSTAQTNLTLSVAAPPPALSIAATANVTAGTAPLDVSFLATVHGGNGPYTVAWTFGNGQSANGVSATTVYPNPGNYTAIATAQDALGNIVREAVPVFVSPPHQHLTAWVVTSLTNGSAPLTVRFLGNAEGGAGGYTFTWRFGNSTSTSNGVWVEHTFATAGIFPVVVNITDAAGASVGLDLAIQAYPPLTVMLSPLPAIPTAGSAVTLGATIGGGDGSVTYTWTLNGTPAYGRDGIFRWWANAGGSYVVTVTATDLHGDRAVATSTVLVAPAPAENLLTLMPPEGWAGEVLVGGYTAGIGGVFLFLLYRGRRPPADGPAPRTLL
jgi:PKD repeat protein